MTDYLRANLDHAIPQAGERSVNDGCWQDQRAQEVRQIVGQCMSNCISANARTQTILLPRQSQFSVRTHMAVERLA
jgi:hypothetical protein